MPPLQALFKETGLASIFVSVIPLKEKGLNLCGPDEANRKAAVAEMIEGVNRARIIGSEAVMLCSGKKPQVAASEESQGRV